MTRRLRDLLRRVCRAATVARGHDRGVVTVWTAGVALSCFMLVGLVVDSGLALRHRSEAFGAAAAAARAGAQELDDRAMLTRDDHSRPVLDQQAAEAAVHDFLAAERLDGLGFTAEVSFPAQDEITVTIRGATDLNFLPVTPSVEVDATVVAVQSSGAGGGGDGDGIGSPDEEGMVRVSCPNGGTIQVSPAIAGGLQALLNAAANDGLQLCGWGYRSSDEQIQLRREHCGTSQYAIYQMPSSQCSPPTARPGTSNHEYGMAVDFEDCGTQSTACYQWLAANAIDYGLRNLPSEAWHWSNDGT